MSELGVVLKFFVFLFGVGLLLVVMAHGIHADKNLADTLGGTGEVLFFAGLGVLLLAKKGKLG
ncbi:MAG TPA: hypothetical protein VFY89_08430 [Ktedonobacterales bacterium]